MFLGAKHLFYFFHFGSSKEWLIPLSGFMPSESHSGDCFLLPVLQTEKFPLRELPPEQIPLLENAPSILVLFQIVVCVCVCV